MFKVYKQPVICSYYFFSSILFSSHDLYIFYIILWHRAIAQAEAILAQYEAEANAFANIIIEQDLTTDGLMAYLGVRVVSEAANPVYAGIEPPAKTSYLGGN